MPCSGQTHSDHSTLSLLTDAHEFSRSSSHRQHNEPLTQARWLDWEHGKIDMLLSEGPESEILMIRDGGFYRRPRPKRTDNHCWFKLSNEIIFVLPSQRKAALILASLNFFSILPSFDLLARPLSTQYIWLYGLRPEGKRQMQWKFKLL